MGSRLQYNGSQDSKMAVINVLGRLRLGTVTSD